MTYFGTPLFRGSHILVAFKAVNGQNPSKVVKKGSQIWPKMTLPGPLQGLPGPYLTPFLGPFLTTFERKGPKMAQNLIAPWDLVIWGVPEMGHFGPSK